MFYQLEPFNNGLTTMESSICNGERVKLTEDDLYKVKPLHFLLN